MGWEETTFTLQDAVETCTDLSGEISDCPLFTILDEATQQECTIELPSDIANEDTAGPVTSIPGDVAIAWGPQAASETAAASASSTSVVIPTLSYSAGSTASVNGSYVPGNAFLAKTTSSSTNTITSIPDGMSATATATSTVTTTNAAGLVVVNEVVYEEVITYVTDSTTTTITVEPTTTPAARRRSAHAHRHVHGRAH